MVFESAQVEWRGEEEGEGVATARGASVSANANKIAQLAPMIPDVFAMDTRSSGVSSDALDGIWEDSDDYKAKAATATERALALAAAADQGQGAFLKAVGGLGSACKGCHEDYRRK